MPEYLLSVHGDSSQEMPEDFDPQPMFDAVERFNTKLREQGHWVYANGLMPSDTATVVDGTGAETVLTDGPVPGVQGAHRRLLDHRRAPTWMWRSRSRRRAAPHARGPSRCAPCRTPRRLTPRWPSRTVR